MGTVYEAFDKRLDTIVALKETHFSDEVLSKQFEREARLLARLHHAALPRVIDHFSESGGQFLVMNFIAGEDLSEMLQRRKGHFPVNEVLSWGDQLLDALDYLHSQEPPVIHRDIKPQYLKLTSRGQVILLDFGLAKGFAGEISRVNTPGSIFGFTPNYAPLEQRQGTGTDARSDLYALAATLYHLITGMAPPDVLTRVTDTTDGKPDPLIYAHEINRDVPQSVAAVINRAMAIGRTQRFSCAREMRESLRESRKREEEARRDIAEAETLYDAPTAERAKAPRPIVAPSFAPEFDAMAEARKQEEETARLKREAEEAVRRAAREREDQEEEERKRREAEEVRHKAEIRRQREEKQKRLEAEEARRIQEEQQRKEKQRRQDARQPKPASSEPAPSVPPSTLKRPEIINWYGFGLAIIGGGILGFLAPEGMSFFVRAGGPILYPFTVCLILASLFGFYLPKIKLGIALCISVSYLSSLWLFRGLFSFISVYQIASFVGALIGTYIGARISQRKLQR